MVMHIAMFFADYPLSRHLFDLLQVQVDRLGGVELHMQKSQVAFGRRKTFARAWIPGRALRRVVAPLVLTLSLRHRYPSPRWKQVVEPYPGRFTHHLELDSPADL